MTREWTSLEGNHYSAQHKRGIYLDYQLAILNKMNEGKFPKENWSLRKGGLVYKWPKVTKVLN